MEQPISTLGLTTDLSKSIFYRNSDARSVYVKDSVLKAVSELETIYAEIGQQADNPTRIFYPAGGADIYPLSIPSAEVLTIFDLTPFLLTHPTQDTQGRSYNFSNAINTILHKNKGSYINLDTLQADPLFTVQDQRDFLTTLEVTTSPYTHSQIEGGFEPLISSFVREELEDNFTKIIGNLMVMGVNLASVQIGVFDDNEYRIQFLLGDTPKTLVYRSVDLNATALRRDTPPNRALRNCFAQFKGPSAIIIKADCERIAQYTIDAIAADTIIAQISTSLDTVKLQHPEYTFSQVSSLSHPNLKWGYGETNAIRIGKKS